MSPHFHRRAETPEREQKYLLKSLLAGLPNPSRAALGRVVVLCYHSIHPRNPWRSASPAQFDEQMSWLKAKCDVVSLKEAFDRAQTKQRSRPTVAITFDDGYEDNHTYALPILVRHEIPASFFLTVGLADGLPEVLDRFRSIRRAEIAGMTWDQVADLRDAGMELGSHTLSHADLAQVDEAWALRELADSRHAIQDRLGTAVESIAYPFGIPGRHFTRKTVEMAREVGYQQGACILYRDVHESDDPLIIPRFAIKNNHLGLLQAKVLGNLDLFGFWQERKRPLLSSHLSADIRST